MSTDCDTLSRPCESGGGCQECQEPAEACERYLVESPALEAVLSTMLRVVPVEGPHGQGGA